jgi:hypothetical protein
MNKKIVLAIGAVLVVAVLAGGAFMAMRLLNTKSLSASGKEGGGANLMTLSQSDGKGGGGGQTFYAKQIPAPELPKQASDLRGQAVSLKDNSIFIGQVDRVTMAVINGVQQTQPTPPGPYTEVVVSKETKIYRDTTMDSMPKPSSGSSADHPQEIQQKVAATDLASITSGSMLQVWGQRRGDRLIADVVVVMGIGVFKGKPGNDSGPSTPAEPVK